MSARWRCVRGRGGAARERVAARHVVWEKRPRARVEEEEEGGGHVTVAGAAAAAL